MLTRNDYFNIALHLKFPELFNFCSSDTSIEQICSSENFWQQYLFINFKVTRSISGLTYKQTAQTIYKFLKLTQLFREYVTLNAFLKFLTFPLDKINQILEAMDKNKSYNPHFIPNFLDINGILSNIGESIEIDENYPDLPEVNPTRDFYVGESNRYTKEELEFIQAVDRYVHKMTPYVTLNGLIHIPFDYEALNNIFDFRKIPESKLQLRDFMDHVYRMFSAESTLIFIRCRDSVPCHP